MRIFINLMKKRQEGTFSEIFDDWKWILSYSKRYKGAILYDTIIGIAGTLLGILSAIASKYLIDIITGYDASRFGLLLIIMITSSVLNLLFSSLLTRISAKISLRIYQDIQLDIFEKIIDSDWLELNKYSSGDILNRFNNDVKTVADNAITWLPAIVINVFHFIAVFCVIFHYDAKMAFIALSGAPFMFFVSKWRLYRMRDYTQKVQEMGSHLMAFEVETFYNYDLVKSFGIFRAYRNRMQTWQKQYKDLYLDYNHFSIRTHILISLMAYFVRMIAFCYCLYLLWTHTIAYGTMTLFLGQGSKLSSAFNNLAGIIPAFMNSSVSAHRIRELTELRKEVHLPVSDNFSKYEGQGFEIQMNAVSFSYDKDHSFCMNASFKASPGEIVAIIGTSGEGKTTLLRLMLGLIHPEYGDVRLIASNGQWVEMNAETRHYFSYVPQGNTILAGTIAENMRMAKENATDEEIIDALKTACAWEFVRTRPETINWTVGEQGLGLSEGQAQRIAIARAILRDAPVLLLDEATSALDIETEQQVLKNIIRQKPNKTCVITTHRPSVLNMCQHIYRTVDGIVTEYMENTGERNGAIKC